mmetsp:Transcript_4903/g.6638  ORF Transcript_4903/g.6638 Transcript_4903/m.6638 type:complete len:234 (+) Transcript_4903:189-890(+)
MMICNTIRKAICSSKRPSGCVVRNISYMLNGEKLYFVLDDKSDLSVDNENSVKILSPISDSNDALTPISCPDEILDIIHGRYQSSEQFVGGMGENDAGVWFTCLYGGDPLDSQYVDIVSNSIRRIKEHRHGIPFGIHTSGLLDGSSKYDLRQDVGTSFCEVSLGTPDPVSFSKHMLLSDSQRKNGSAIFGKVCSFIARTGEQGFPVEVGVLKEYEGSASELAASLGAVGVNPY